MISPAANSKGIVQPDFEVILTSTSKAWRVRFKNADGDFRYVDGFDSVTDAMEWIDRAAKPHE